MNPYIPDNVPITRSKLFFVEPDSQFTLHKSFCRVPKSNKHSSKKTFVSIRVH